MINSNKYATILCSILIAFTATYAQSDEVVTKTKIHSYLRNHDDKRELGLFDAIQDIFTGVDENDNSTSEKEDNNNNITLPGLDGIFGDILDIFNVSTNNETDKEDKNDTDVNTDWFDNFLGNITDTISNITDTLFGENNTTTVWSNGSFFDGNGTFLDDLFDFTNVTDGGFFDTIFNSTDGGFLDGGLFNGTIGGIFDGFFNMTDDNNITDIISNFVDIIKNLTSNASPIIPPFNGFISEWDQDVIFSKDKTCKNVDDAPDCFDSFGQDGFWVCRTLSNPFTGSKSSKNLCVNKGQYLTNNDECGCCIPDEETVPTCPKLCECSCTLPNGKDGVSVNVTTLFGNSTMCVDSRWAVSTVGLSDQLTCNKSCKN